MQNPKQPPAASAKKGAPVAPRKPDRAPWILGALLVLAIVLAYQPAWHAGYIWDDDVYVTQNRLLTAPDGLKRIWFSTDSPSQYFPLTYTVLRAEHALWGFKAAGYHWVNILWHAVNALVLWRLLRRLAVPGAFLAAAIFALHPVQVESVAWITELKNILSLFFYLLAVSAWVEFIDPKKTRKWAWYASALAFSALALFSKTTACTLPAALMLVLWLQGRPLNFLRYVQVAPFLAIGVGMGLLTVWWEHNKQGTYGEIFQMSFVERLLVASHAIWFYAWKLLCPVNLIFSYPRWNIDPAAPGPYAWLIAAIGAAAAIYYAVRRIGRAPAAAAIFYVATLSPVLGFFMLYTFRYSFVADHYQYAASIGPLALLAAAVTQRLIKAKDGLTREIARLACAALLVLLAVLTWNQAQIYANSETLWRATIARNPDSTMAHNNLAYALIERGALDESLEQSRVSLKINPADPSALANMGGALLLKGQPQQAVGYCQQSIAAQPLNPKPYYTLGQAWLRAGNLPGAITNFQKSIDLKPDFAPAFCNLGYALLMEGRAREAIPDYEKALALDPDYALAHNDLGHILLDSGRTAEAIPHFQRAVQAAPAFYEARFNLGEALFKSGRPDEAAVEFSHALELHPNLPEAEYQLGNIANQSGRFADAEVHYAGALKLRPNFVPACNSLAWLLATTPDAAVRNGPKAVELASTAEKLTSGHDPNIISTLAAAYAEAGKFSEAVSTAQRALAGANAQNNAPLAATIRTCLEDYQAGSPLRDSRRPPRGDK